MKRRLFFPAVSLFVLCSCSTVHKNEIKQVEWLIGTWENKTENGSIYETWNRLNDDKFSGKSYMLKEKDTVVFETLLLVQESEGLFYIPTVKNQNDNQPVRFALKTISDTKLVFENPQHDFPQFISYTKISGDSVIAEISGTKNGKELKETFPMKQVK